MRFKPFLVQVFDFPIGLSPRTIQGFGSAQKLVIFITFRAWFPHRLESEDHTRPWFCPWAHMLNGPGPRIYWAHKSRGVFITFDHAVPFGVPVFEVHLLETPLTSGLQMTLEVEPETFCL